MSFLQRWRQRRAKRRAAACTSPWEVETTGDLVALMRKGQERRGIDLNGGDRCAR